jgi:hypothetical protein
MPRVYRARSILVTYSFFYDLAYFSFFPLCPPASRPSLAPTGHPRNHAAADAEVLAGLSDRKLPITTNDERFAAEAGIPFSAGL